MKKLGVVLLAVLMAGSLLAGCAKTQEVVKPYSTLESSVQPSGAAISPTQNPWPTAAVSPGAVIPTVTAAAAKAATVGAMVTQPQTGPDFRSWLLVLTMLGGGLGLVIWGMQGQMGGKSHAHRK